MFRCDVKATRSCIVVPSEELLLWNLAHVAATLVSDVLTIKMPISFDHLEKG